ncbi:MAG TPA: inorganic phosphate transporter [Cyclobacteriaceae bacterium]|nr:inorganic phosphate transporter [Cyclobacteriaceae bacterium]HPW62421.1 inorganic phosphate transporter [Cyclobacteriaceae bacterium]
MDFYLIFVIILMAIAVVDLIVGVSNDAVNFLNSAIGSKVAPFRTILFVASLGILAGSLFSSGMMEIARNGIFNPNFFTFDKIIIVFLAVMLTDIILLDFFNSLGLPTSTTVSLVFELLGAALVTGLLISFDRAEGFETWQNIINYSSAVTIIVGIFLSVFLSFILGAAVQHVARILFTFKLKKTLKRYGAIFSGVAISAIIYFLLIKGAKGSSFITDAQVKWITANTWIIMVVSIVMWSIIIQVLMWWQKINPLKVVVLLGTFSLAMAFAGNDLVNFIGVSVAGLVSFQAWTASGIPASEYTMSILNEKIATPSWILFAGGVVMVLTLWTNAKSRKVTETEVSLGRQDEGDERFKPNIISRGLVGGAMWIGRQIEKSVPESWTKNLAIRFEKENTGNAAADQASFDLIRASINLVVASVLIAYGTSQKLPLSTTFVTFMVAMGSSFADQAWGRESAVYRVAGVMNVIAGWLVTAVAALLSSGLLAFIMYKTGMAGPLVLTVVAAFLLIRSHVVFNRKVKEEKADNRLLEEKQLSIHQAIQESKNNTAQTLKTINQVIVQSLRALLKEDENLLRKSRNELEKLRTQNEKFDSKIIKYVRKMDKGNLLTGRLYILVFDLMQDLYQSARLVNEVVMAHVVNHHSPPKKKYAEWMVTLERGISDYAIKISEHIAAGTGVNVATQEEQKRLIQFLNKSLDELVIDIQKDDLGNRMGLLQTRVLLELRDIVVELGELHAVYDDHSKPIVVN